MERLTDRSIRISRVVISILLVFAALFLAAAPIAAVWYSRQPFPGFMVESTLVINANSGTGWGPAKLGMSNLERVLSLGNQPISDSGSFRQALIAAGVASRVELHTLTPLGEERVYPDLVLVNFPSQDSLTLFWMPFLISVVYLLLAMWVHRTYGFAIGGRGFVYFCLNAALVSGLFFDGSSTHFGSTVWTFAVAQIGGAMVAMAVLIPEPLPGFRYHRWVRLIGYGVSTLLAAWGLYALYLDPDAWAYITPWRWSYIYAGFGIFLFLSMMVFRLTRPISLIAREQIRIILAGSLVAFLPVGIWFIAQLFTAVRFNPILFLPLLLFPISIAVAILRYHLWDIDLIIRRTLVYTTLTLTLVVIYLALIILLEQVFRNYIGDNTIFTVISTLVIVGLFSPLRRWIQKIVDRRFFRQKYNIELTMLEFRKRTSSQVSLTEVSSTLMQVVQDTLQPEFLSLWIKKTPKPTDASGEAGSKRSDV